MFGSPWQLRVTKVCQASRLVLQKITEILAAYQTPLLSPCVLRFCVYLLPKILVDCALPEDTDTLSRVSFTPNLR